jgi:hypothetical protein
MLLLVIGLPLIFCNWTIQGLLASAGGCELVDQQDDTMVYFCAGLTDAYYYAKETTTGEVYMIRPAAGTYTDICTEGDRRGMPNC